MRKKTVISLVILISLLSNLMLTNVSAAEIEKEGDSAEHNWVEYSTSFETIEVGTHEYSYWKNLIRHTRTCHISHVIKTVVYYCDEHDHTKVETELVETIHSGNHN
ncbi:hypothetical protein ACDX78_09070 [Virgibacillus oceani]